MSLILNRKQYILAWLVSLLIIVTLIDVVFYLLNLPEPEFLLYAWSFVFYVLVIMWVEEDAREKGNIYLPFEYSFLVYVFGLIYLPYYLIRTRKWNGLLYIAGVIVAFKLGYLIKLSIHYWKI